MESQGSFLDTGIAYVRFAVGHRAHFEVMFRPELYHPGDPGLQQARAAAESLYGSGNPSASQLAAGVAAWSLMHGLATLWLNGNLPGRLGDDPEQIARAVAIYLQVPDSLQTAPEAGSGHPVSAGHAADEFRSVGAGHPRGLDTQGAKVSRPTGTAWAAVQTAYVAPGSPGWRTRREHGRPA